MFGCAVERGQRDVHTAAGNAKGRGSGGKDKSRNIYSHNFSGGRGAGQRCGVEKRVRVCTRGVVDGWRGANAAASQVVVKEPGKKPRRGG